MKELFFNSSLPRSGSTLIQNILAQNPKIYTTPTNGLVELVAQSRVGYTNSVEFKALETNTTEKAYFNYIRGGMLSFFDDLTDRDYVIDKSRGWMGLYDFLFRIFDNPKIICMIRDLRAVYASMEKNYRKHPELDINSTQWQGKGGTVEQRIDIWSQAPPVGASIERLFEAYRMGHHSKMLFVKYEDLCDQPVKTLTRIYNYLGIDVFDHNFNHIDQFTNEDDKWHGIFGDHIIKNSLQKSEPDFKDVLGNEACKWIKGKYEWFYDIFKYY